MIFRYFLEMTAYHVAKVSNGHYDRERNTRVILLPIYLPTAKTDVELSTFYTWIYYILYSINCKSWNITYQRTCIIYV